MPRNPNKRNQVCRTATASTPEGEIQRHLKELGLASTEDYRAWCRQHGFGPALHKGWQERREEVRHARKIAEETEAEGRLQRHIEALGLKTREAYGDWCTRHGFSDALHKTPQQLRHERTVADRERAEKALAGARRQQRKPENVIESLSHNTIEPELLKSPLYREIHALFAGVGPQPEHRQALCQLLLHAHKQTRLLALEPAIPHLGPQAGNTFLHGLAALAYHRDRWLRPLEDWRPESHNTRRQFGSLARHLLAKYPVPAFMDAAWFSGDSLQARRQQEWFIHIGVGRNIRRADLPLRLTEKAAHFFLGAPRDFSIEAAFRWGQIQAMGGNEYLVRAIASTRLAEFQEDEAFWASVLQFFVNSPMLDGSWIGPMVDYIHHRRFAPQEIVGPEGLPVQIGPLEPEFSMKGRTVTALWQRVEEWHRHLAKETRRPPLEWAPSGIGALSYTERDPDTGSLVCWTIEELLSSRQLTEEGKALHHCVASYAHSCARGSCSIWSMQVEDCRAQIHRRVMTIEVSNARRFVAQARGRYNKTPGAKHSSPRLNRAPAILKQWAGQEGLTIPGYI
jgi:hypothetical protein